VDGDEDLDPDNTNSVTSTVLITIHNEFEHKCFEQAVRLLITHPIHQSIDTGVPSHKYSIPSLRGMKLHAHQVWVI
jgi:hypothetical protein